MTAVATASSTLHLTGPDTTAAQRERMEFFRAGPASAVRALPPERSPIAERLADWSDPGRLARIVADADVIHLWTRIHLPAIARQGEARGRFGARGPTLILHVDSTVHLRDNVRLYFDVPRAGLRFACTSAVLRSAYEREGVAPEHLALIPEVAPQLPAGPDRATVRDALRIPAGAFAVLLAPPLTRWSRTALWGALMASKVHSHVRAIIYGSGNNANRLERFVRSVGGDDWTVFVRSPAAWPALAYAADLGLHVAQESPPRWGLLTLLRAGVPVVARESAETREVLPGDQDALFVQSDAPPLVSATILRAIEEPASLPNVAAAAARRLAPFEPEPVRSAFERGVLRLLGDLRDPGARSAGR